jgi:HAD superfamily hydrolase (TIGR01509 family)
MVKAIFWDNDGVLVDTERLYFLATQRVLASVGINLTQQMYFDLFLVQATGAWHLAEEKGFSSLDVDRLRRERNALYLTLLQTESEAIDGVDEVLRLLRGKYLMGVVTSSHREHFEAAHRRTGLSKYFDFTLTAEDYSKYKPDPEPYLAAVTKTGFSKDECIAIEDSVPGLTSATAAGLRCVIIPNDLTRSGNFDRAYQILKNVRGIPALLSRTFS